jgi:hypothetical protein
MTDRNPEQDWFRVHVGEDAEFITRAASGDAAETEVKAHCELNPYLKLETSMMLDHGVWAKPLEPIEADHYQKIVDMTGVNSVRLVADKREQLPVRERPRTTQHQISDGQLALFGIKKKLTGRNNFEYSYYYE